MSWSDDSEALRGIEEPRSPAGAAAFLTAMTSAFDGSDPTDPGRREELRRSGLGEALAEVDRDALVALAEDPRLSRDEIEAAISHCIGVRRAAGASEAPTRYARIEMCAALGQRAEALSELREARLFAMGDIDPRVTLAAATFNDDFSGVIRTASSATLRKIADPSAAAEGLSSSLLPYLAQGRRVEGEDALATLDTLETPGWQRLRVLGRRLEYMALAGQWERAMAVMRHTDLKNGSQSTAWTLMNTAACMALVLREAVRAGYGQNALGAAVQLRSELGPELALTGWDTVAHAYDMATTFARVLARIFDERNGGNGVSERIETRMAAEASSLRNRSYGTMTGGFGMQAETAANRATLVQETQELLVLARGYGLGAVRERAMRTAEMVSDSLAAGIDETQLEVIIELRVVFARLLLALGATERAEGEALRTAELCLSQGWQEIACASYVTAGRAASERHEASSAREHANRVSDILGDWGTSRMSERLTVLVEAIGDHASSVLLLTDLAERTCQNVEQDNTLAAPTREACRKARSELGKVGRAPEGVEARLTAVEERIAPYGRGRGGRHRAAGSAATDDSPA
ncbi:hypothetical protein CHIBA101_1173 [Actinomyces sp. Chiba101]|uniref:Tetratricopeptide repeat-containing protein n=1 Tax=Actinomyces denticolens TaxID=52767 RepID=A0ABY1I5I4_9ACTO|nr:MULTISPECIES: hypothetical protein [Actinomyces]BAW93036.1 hypothetical protein CHIBA101_1173 [Actinomyces sp. Chiba101]GAV95739.1 hypothetical protein ADENT20671_2543 [Actinomyces denticolens]SHI61856.1 hypothetical protein SAMN05216246_103154 [Actinomyces denticolens]SUU05440.1 Uncharacterised protein [Actinomyces denticolens]